MISGEELNKILRTIEICAIDYNKNEDGMESFEWSELWLLDSYINDLQQENQKSKEVIDKAKELINKCVEAQLENDYLMDRINLANYNMKLLDILNEVE